MFDMYKFSCCHCIISDMGYLAQVGNGIELDTVQFEPYQWRPCGVTWDFVPEESW